jgi:hypothetical protein
MTIHAVEVPMHGLREFLPVDKDFLPWLQRSHLAPSANAFGLSLRGLLRFGRFDQAILV